MLIQVKTMRAILFGLVFCTLCPSLLAAEGTALPGYDTCPGTFYGVSKYERFSWAGHYRAIEGNTDQLMDDERLAFQATTKQFTDAHTEILLAIKDLRHLSLVGTSVTDQGLKAAESTTSLLTVNIWSCPAVTNTGIAAFKGNSELYSASVGFLRSVDDDWMAVFEHWPKLKELRVDGTPVKGEGFRHTKHTPELEWIEGWNVFSITDTAFEHLSGLKSLRNLTLWECRDTTSAGLQKLKSCVNLEEIKLVGVSGVDDEFAGVLAGLASLRCVDLSYSKDLTDLGVAALSKRLSIEELDVGDCEQLTDKAIAHLSALENLTLLKLGGCTKLTAGCLPEILKLKKLEAIQIPPSFDEVQQDAIIKAFPNIKFELI
jgi:hypothetical protein